MFFENTLGGNITTFWLVENWKCKQDKNLGSKQNFEKANQFWYNTNESIVLSDNKLNFCAVKQFYEKFEAVS